MADNELSILLKMKDEASKQLDGFKGKLEKTSKTLRMMGVGMIAAGGAIAAGLGAAVSAYAKAGDEVHKMALRTGFTAESLSELRHVAMLSGTELGTIEKASKKMSKSIIDAERGLETYARSFEELGLDIKQLRAMSPEEQFWAISNALADLEDHTLKASVAQEIFGRAGTELLPMLAASSEAIAEQRQEAHDLGVVFDDEAAQKAATFTDALGTLKESMQGVGFALADTLIPIITEFLNDNLIPTITKISDWIKTNEDLAKGLAILAGVLIGGGGLLIALGMISKAIIAINAALIVMHSLSGIGLLKVGLGLAAATGLIIGMKELLKTETPLPEIPGLAGGGIVTRPTLSLIGEAGPEAIVPLSSALGTSPLGGGSTTVNINVGSFMGDESSLRELTRRIKDIMGQDSRRTSFPGINRLEYFPGSSSV